MPLMAVWPHLDREEHPTCSTAMERQRFFREERRDFRTGKPAFPCGLTDRRTERRGDPDLTIAGANGHLLMGIVLSRLL